jgi:cytosine/adenosine deaminase-related metal-dependent hydrolase
MTPFSLRARWVLPVDGPPIAGGYVTIRGPWIAGVGAARPGEGPVEDLGDVALLPGLVNAHTHLEFSDLTAPLGRPGMALPEWIRLVIADRKRARRDAESAIASGLAESLAAGVTTIGDICTSPAAASSDKPRPMTVAFQESIGFSTQRVDSAYADVERRLRLATPPPGLSPHAPYTVHPDLVGRIVRLARDRGVPVAMHLAESREELELLAAGAGSFRALLEERSMWDAAVIPRGCRPLDYLRRLAEAPRTLVIHGNYLAADEIDFLGQRRDEMSVAFCPRTHAYFGHNTYPLEELRRAGVRIALGTDSRASNPDLNLLTDLRFAALLFPNIQAPAWLRMATLDAADALGLGQEVGSLSPGKRADVIALPCGAAAEPWQAIVGGNEGVGRVWLAGRALPDTN